MTSKIIELKEIYDPSPKDEGDESRPNGAFTNRFNEKIRLDKGDSLKIKSVFINDSTGPEGNIVFDEPLDVTITVGYYVRDWGSYNYESDYKNGKTFVEKTGAIPAPAGGLTEPRTNNHFVFCRPITHDATGFKITELRLVWRRSMVFGGDWEGLDATVAFTYIAVNSDILMFNCNITKKEVQRRLEFDSVANVHFIRLNAKNNSMFKHGSIPFPLYAKSSNAKAFTNVSTVKMGSEGIYDMTGTATIDTTEHFITHKKDISFTIPRNRFGYSPAQLSQIVTDEMTKFTSNDAHTSDTATSSLLLTTTLIEETTSGGIFLDENANRLYTTNVTGNVDRDSWIGSNQFALVYREDLGGKFELQGTHMALYSGGAEGVLLLKAGTQNYVANKHSGIFITSVNPPNFFNDYFRINDADLMSCEGPPVDNQIIGPFANGTIFPTYTFVEGKNVTGQMVSIDTVINKEDFGFEKPSAHSIMDETLFVTTAGANAGVSASFIAESQHVTIMGEKAVAEQLQDAYYQIEIDLPIRADFNSSQKNNKKIQGIVGRYYNTNGYTQSMESEGALSYIHDSEEPLYISELNVRILDSKGELATNIQPDNTVLLEILKQDPNQI